MRATIFRLAAPTWKTLKLVVPPLLVTVLLASQAYGVAQRFPVITRLERQVDAILATEQADIKRQAQLLATQNAINKVLKTLNQQLNKATNPVVIARLEQAIATKESQLQTVEQALTQNRLRLQRDLNVLVPIKDRDLQRLASIKYPPHPLRQIRLFVIAATQRENLYAELIKRFLAQKPVTPTTPTTPVVSF